MILYAGENSISCAKIAYKLVGSGLLLNDKVCSGGDVSTLQRRIAMIQTSQVHHCRDCGSAHIVKNGHNRCGSSSTCAASAGRARCCFPSNATARSARPRCCEPIRSAPRCTDGVCLKRVSPLFKAAHPSPPLSPIPQASYRLCGVVPGRNRGCGAGS